MKSEDVIPKDLAAQIAKAVAAGFKQGTKEAFSANSFLNDLTSKLEEQTKEQEAQILNGQIQKKSLNERISLEEAEIVVLAEKAKMMNNDLINQLLMNKHTAYQGFLLARMNGDLAGMAESRIAFGEAGKAISSLEKQNELIQEQADLVIEGIKSQEEKNKVDEQGNKVKDKIHETTTALKNQIGVTEDLIDLLKTPELAKAVFAEQMGEKIHKAYEAFELFKNQGLSAGQAIEAQFKGMDLMSMMGLSDVKGVTTAMITEFGNVNALSGETTSQLGKMAVHMGITGEEAGKLAASLSTIPGETADSAANAMELTGHLAEMQGIAPGKIMADMAKNTGEMSRQGNKGAEAFGKSVIALHKMGVEMGTASKIADGLLDFESSINAQMEASVLLGKEVNLDKARELALHNDIEGATAEVLKNIGGSAEFSKLNRLQQDALAKATGMTVEELNKAVDAQEESNKYFGEGASAGASALGYLAEYGGKSIGFFKENGLLLLSSIQLLSSANAMKLVGNGLLIAKNVVLAVGNGLLMAGSFLMNLVTGGIAGQIGKLIVKNTVTAAGHIADKAHAVWARITEGTQFGLFMANIAKRRAARLAEAAMDKGIAAQQAAGGLAAGGGASAGMAGLAGGLIAMGAPGVGKGALNLALFGLAAIPALLGIPFLLFMGMGLAGKGALNLALLATGLLAMAPTRAGSSALLLFAIAGALAIPSLIFLGGIALMGEAAMVGLEALGLGLESLGAVAATGLPFLAIALIAALGVAMIPFGIALMFATPAIEAFGKIIIGVFSALPPIITAVADGFVKIFGAVSQDIGSFLLLGPALMMTGMGLMSMAAGGLMAMPIIGMLIALATVAPALVGLGAALGGMFGGGGGEKEDKMDTLIAKIDTLISVASKGGVINMDGKKVGEVIRQSLNSTGIR